ncbi:hypothetical protein FOZ62_009574, partial [Perkinsus olseni]
MSASGEYSLSNAWAVAPWVSRTVAVVHLIGMSIAWLMAEVVHYRSTPEYGASTLVIYCVYSWHHGCHGRQEEASMGSWRCLALTLACLMAINGIFIGVMEAACLSSGISFDPYFGCNQYLWGMWPFAMFIVTRQCMDHPRGRVDFWGAWQISNKWYPVFLLVFLSAAQMRILWDCLSGVLLALIWSLVSMLASTRVCGGTCRYLMLRCCPS